MLALPLSLFQRRLATCLVASFDALAELCPQFGWGGFECPVPKRPEAPPTLKSKLHKSNLQLKCLLCRSIFSSGGWQPVWLRPLMLLRHLWPMGFVPHSCIVHGVPELCHFHRHLCQLVPTVVKIPVNGTARPPALPLHQLYFASALKQRCWHHRS